MCFGLEYSTAAANCVKLTIFPTTIFFLKNLSAWIIENWWRKSMSYYYNTVFVACILLCKFELAEYLKETLFLLKLKKRKSYNLCLRIYMLNVGLQHTLQIHRVSISRKFTQRNTSHKSPATPADWTYTSHSTALNKRKSPT